MKIIVDRKTVIAVVARALESRQPYIALKAVDMALRHPVFKELQPRAAEKLQAFLARGNIELALEAASVACELVAESKKAPNPAVNLVALAELLKPDGAE